MAKQYIEPPIINDVTTAAILGHVELNHKLGTRQPVSVICRTSTQRISKRHKLYPYKIKLTQELSED